MAAEVLGIIPARGGSKGIPRKNIKLLAGKPLIAYTIEAALQSRGITRVVVSTEDEEIAEISRSFGAEAVMRPANLSEDATPTLPVLLQVCEELEKTGTYRPDVVATLQATSPLRTPLHLDESVSLFLNDDKADSLLSVVEVPHMFHPTVVFKKSSKDYLLPFVDQEKKATRRQDKEVVYAGNGAAVYLTKREKLPEYITGGNVIPYYMAEDVSIDIDDMNDFKKAEDFLNGC